MEITLGELASLVDGEVVGDPGIRITGISGIKEARKGDITFLANDRYAPLLQTTKAAACIVSVRMKEAPLPVLRVKNPDLAFATIVTELSQPPIPHTPGVHAQAVVAEDRKVFNAHAEFSGQVNTRFNGKNLSLFQEAITAD